MKIKLVPCWILLLCSVVVMPARAQVAGLKNKTFVSSVTGDIKNYLVFPDSSTFLFMQFSGPAEQLIAIGSGHLVVGNAERINFVYDSLFPQQFFPGKLEYSASTQSPYDSIEFSGFVSGPDRPADFATAAFPELRKVTVANKSGIFKIRLPAVPFVSKIEITHRDLSPYSFTILPNENLHEINIQLPLRTSNLLRKENLTEKFSLVKKGNSEIRLSGPEIFQESKTDRVKIIELLNQSLVAFPQESLMIQEIIGRLKK
ncbi:MAG: hypothetical protein JWQ27_1164 [Ferruginibacter sp.]|nr:hypothetical protein [Ferruginibacter sp.]